MTIPSTHAEIEQIYLTTELSNCKSLCITACQSGDGVTSIASALAERYLLAGYKTLLVDLNMFHPAFRKLSLHSGKTIKEHWIEDSYNHRLFTGITIPNDSSKQLAYKDPSVMKGLIEKWLNHFERIIIDTSPLLKINRNNIPAQNVASACEKTILIVRGGITTINQIETAISLLKLETISLLGTVLNKKEQTPLNQELICTFRKIPFISKTLRDKIESWLLKNTFLS
ncbi:AAA family ATPase [Candidatus Photodesmus anomalopis]|uniref:ATPase involved in chromosome partitioning n=1 Tax=Candidatus Photodesmus katoptron Akat1 TaxID=1236703 RepID=S3DJT1_9GAMM|nr:AAA family ATPase [Candidatus Photodesmus katoptron]EPE37409.1 ATPase involved in chromosome partitioning [Candidatus Photodesmus katoptron Akat1]